MKKWQAVDQNNTRRTKQIVAKYGWPGKSLVGEDGARAAWLLLQHADLNRAFQKRVLPLLHAAAAKGEARKQDLAYLTDRVLSGEGKKQIYGTQITMNAQGEFVARPTQDEANVDARRKAMGLPSMAEYLAFASEQMAAAKKPKPGSGSGDGKGGNAP